MPDNVTYELASIAEPLSVVIQATRRAQAPQPGQSVLILGCGAVGLLSAALAKSMGATKITVVDIDQAKLDFCEAQGWATETVLLPRGPRVSGKESLEAAKKTVSELFEPKFGSDGWDCVFECSGVEVSFPFLSLESALLSSVC
jgi:L-iditol 2-dehydrogenase